MKKCIVVTSKMGVAVPGLGRLGVGDHVDIEIDSKQMQAIADSGQAAVMTAAEYKKHKKG